MFAVGKASRPVSSSNRGRTSGGSNNSNNNNNNGNRMGACVAFGVVLFFIVASLVLDSGNHHDADLSVRIGQAHKPTIHKDVVVSVGTVKDDNKNEDNDESVIDPSVGTITDKTDVEFQLVVDEAETHFTKAKNEQLNSNQNRISSDIATLMESIRKDLQKLFVEARTVVPTGGGDNVEVKLDGDEIERMGNLIEDEIRGLVRTELDVRCKDMLDEKTVDMEAAVDIDEEFEEEGEADPIDLTDEEADLVVEVKKAVDDIVVAVLDEMPAMALKVVSERIVLTLNEKYAPITFEVDVDAGTNKVTGWHVAGPPNQTLDGETKKDEEATDKDNQDKPTVDETKEDGEPANKDETKEESTPQVEEAVKEEPAKEDDTQNKEAEGGTPQEEPAKEGDTTQNKEAEGGTPQEEPAKVEENNTATDADSATEENKVKDESAEETKATEGDNEPPTGTTDAEEKVGTEDVNEENNGQ